MLNFSSKTAADYNRYPWFMHPKSKRQPNCPDDSKQKNNARTARILFKSMQVCYLGHAFRSEIFN